MDELRPDYKQPEYSGKTYELSERSLERLQGIEPTLLDIVLESITHSPHDFGIPRYGGMRSAEDQKKLYEKGRSQRDGYNKLSYHQTGRAFDIYVLDDEGKPTWNSKYHYKYEEVARHIQKIAKEKFFTTVTWGGDWTSFVDRPHFQI